VFFRGAVFSDRAPAPHLPPDIRKHYELAIEWSKKYGKPTIGSKVTRKRLSENSHFSMGKLTL